MSKNNSIIVLLLLFSLMVMSCGMLKDEETANLRKEVEELKKEKEDLAKQQEANKNAATPKPKPKISAPVGSTVAFCNATDVVVRKSASLQAKKVTSLRKGEKVFVIEESDNTDEWKGTKANWALIQKENGQRGWVFTPFISY